MKSYSSREILKMLVEDGWYEVKCVGDHHQFKHPTKPGKVTLQHCNIRARTSPQTP